ncbi:7-cyano-7-deazaguanine synthase [Acidithiobacillus sp. AMEEHan]|uniref:7-cyano-7-deazaguanine synthase n=1 Tax=Acidithiobacillus sp. AMEEHan TaxID=2994951 RepID=UPI0027E55DDB|nr:7-cyano-7-deazaguanine synthase [Acidithiobacillus sp. AMEEHan]
MKTGLLLSGGMDSISIAWWKRPQWAATIDYGQKAAAAEKRSAAQICKVLRIEHEVITVDCSALGSGDMANTAPNAHATTSDWWPYRNQLLITLACMRAISREVQTLYIGTVKSDGESHRDGTPEFVRRMDDLLASQEGVLHIVAPAIEYTTAELVRTAAVPPGLLAWAHSCHKAEIACGNCRGCNKYLATFAELGSEYSSVA